MRRLFIILAFALAILVAVGALFGVRPVRLHPERVRAVAISSDFGDTLRLVRDPRTIRHLLAPFWVVQPERVIYFPPNRCAYRLEYSLVIDAGSSRSTVELLDQGCFIFRRVGIDNDWYWTDGALRKRVIRVLDAPQEGP